MSRAAQTLVAITAVTQPMKIQFELFITALPISLVAVPGKIEGGDQTVDPQQTVSS